MDKWVGTYLSAVVVGFLSLVRSLMPAHERSLQVWCRLVGDCFRLVVVVSISLCETRAAACRYLEIGRYRFSYFKIFHD